MGELRGALKPITDLAMVCTEKQFADMFSEDNSLLEKEYVYLSSVQVRGEICGGLISGELPSSSIAVIPTSCSAAYLAFLLNSLPCQYMLFNEKLNVKANMKITRKSVARLSVYEVEAESEDAYGIAESLREQIYSIYRENKDDLKYQHLYFIISDLCNILALELFAHPMFEEMGIFIIANWKKLVAEYKDRKDLRVLFDGLIMSNSPLRNMIMKVHMSENVFETYLKKHADGLEN